MPTEYVLQKKVLGGWSYVTWYGENELDKAQRSFDSVTKGDTGYSWRLVKLETLTEKLLNDPIPVMQDEEETVEPRKTSWGTVIPNPKKAVEPSNWGKPPSFSSTPSDNKDHGMIGKVWLGNPTTKEKKRVDPSMVDDMMAQGWIKAGPRTVL